MTDAEILKEHHSERVEVDTWSRCMGYFRPVHTFNVGKQGEHNERQFFTEDNTTREIGA